MTTSRYYIKGDGTVRTVYCYRLGPLDPIQVVVDGTRGVKPQAFRDDTETMALNHIAALEHWLEQDSESVTEFVP